MDLGLTRVKIIYAHSSVVVLLWRRLSKIADYPRLADFMRLFQLLVFIFKQNAVILRIECEKCNMHSFSCSVASNRIASNHL